MSVIEARVYERTVEIEWGQCDPAGIVYYPRYFEIFDNATAHMIAAAVGMSKYELLKKHNALGFPIVKTGAEFRSPSKYGDHVKIETRITAIGRSSFEVKHVLHNNREPAVEAFENRVWVSRTASGSIEATALPAELISALRA